MFADQYIACATFWADLAVPTQADSLHRCGHLHGVKDLSSVQRIAGFFPKRSAMEVTASDHDSGQGPTNAAEFVDLQPLTGAVR